jgi:hypothetical protein
LHGPASFSVGPGGRLDAGHRLGLDDAKLTRVRPREPARKLT